ncbi:MAG TPA: MFS transporter [Actinocrinis sp.]
MSSARAEPEGAGSGGEPAAEADPDGPWAPMRDRVFRSLWFAQLGSNVGTWMQTVGAQWLLVERAHAATLVALVQTASLLPVMLLSLPAGGSRTCSTGASCCSARRPRWRRPPACSPR